MLRTFAVLLFLVLGRLCYFTEPYGVSVDESTYLSIAEVMHSGGVLYKDAVDRKPPGLLWLYQVVGPWNIHGIHFLFFVQLLFLILLAGWIFKEVRPRSSTGTVAMLLFAFSSSSFPREILSANAEYPMLVCLGISFYLFLRFVDTNRWIWLFSSVVFAVNAVMRWRGCLPVSSESVLAVCPRAHESDDQHLGPRGDSADSAGCSGELENRLPRRSRMEAGQHVHAHFLGRGRLRVARAGPFSDPELARNWLQPRPL